MGGAFVVSGAEPDRGTRLYLQDLDSGEPRPITPEGVRLAQYGSRVVSPDGRFVTALGPDRRAALYPIEGGEPREIAGLGDGNFSKNPNKRHYAYILTPPGLEEKTRITLAFLQHKEAEFQAIQREIETLKSDLESPRAAGEVD